MRKRILESTEAEPFFGAVENTGILCMFLFCVVSNVLIVMRANLLLLGFCVLVIIFAAIKNTNKAFGYYLLAIEHAGLQLPGTTFVILEAALLVILFFSSRTYMRIKARNLKILIVATLCLIVSFVCGVNPSAPKALLMMLCILNYLVITDQKSDDVATGLVLALIMCGISRCMFVSYQIIIGGQYMRNGRLNVFGNSKTLATACVVPLQILICSWLQKRNMFRHKGSMRLFTIVLILVFLVAVFLSGARAIFIALIITTALFALVSMRQKNAFRRTVFVVLVFAALYVLLMDINLFRVSRLLDTENIDTLTARFDIWRFYYGQMQSKGPVTMLFGFGPGNVSRVAAGTVFSDAYAHSTVLDYLFSYGYLGLTVFLVFQCWVLNRIKRNSICFMIVLLCLIMYSTHSASENYNLYFIEAIMVLHCESDARRLTESRRRSVNGRTDLGLGNYSDIQASGLGVQGS